MGMDKEFHFTLYIVMGVIIYPWLGLKSIHVSKRDPFDFPSDQLHNHVNNKLHTRGCVMVIQLIGLCSRWSAPARARYMLYCLWASSSGYWHRRPNRSSINHISLLHGPIKHVFVPDWPASFSSDGNWGRSSVTVLLLRAVLLALGSDTRLADLKTWHSVRWIPWCFNICLLRFVVFPPLPIR